MLVRHTSKFLVPVAILAALSLTPKVLADTSPAETGGDQITVENPLINQISFSVSNGTISLSNGYTGVTNQAIGTVNIKSNAADGFEVHVKSLNGGAFKLGTTEYTMPYSLRYNSATSINAGSWGTADTYVSTALEDSAFNADAASSAGVNRGVDVTIADSAVAGRPAGDYTDTLTFRLTAK